MGGDHAVPACGLCRGRGSRVFERRRLQRQVGGSDRHQRQPHSVFPYRKPPTGQNRRSEGDSLTFEVSDNAGRVVQFRLSLTGGTIVGESTAGGRKSRVALSRGGGIGAGGGGFRSPMPEESPRPGVYRVGGGVTPPVLIDKTEPEYTEEARHAKYQGTVLLRVEIDPAGVATNIKVQRSLGLGLDQKAVEAVQKWRFKPGMKDGNPVTVQATIEVNFRL
jgi:TonB family protein